METQRYIKWHKETYPMNKWTQKVKAKREGEILVYYAQAEGWPFAIHCLSEEALEWQIKESGMKDE